MRALLDLPRGSRQKIERAPQMHGERPVGLHWRQRDDLSYSAAA